MSTQVNIGASLGIKQGMTINIIIPVKDPVTLLPVDLTGRQLEMTVYPDDADGSPALIPTKTALAVTNVNGTNDGIVYPLAHNDTVLSGVNIVGAGKFYYEAWDTAAPRPIAFGDFVLLSSPRRA